MRRLAAAETSFPLILTLPLGGGVLRSQVTPRAPEPTPNPSQEESSNGWPVPLLGEVRGGLISGRFMESLHSLLHMHWDHEPRNWSGRATARRDQRVLGAPDLAELELRAPVHGE